MEHYIVTKKVTLQAKSREFHKDRIITVDDVGSENIERYLKKGYIKLLGGDNAANNLPGESSLSGAPSGLPFYMTSEDLLTPEQVNKLIKKQLIEYAGHIGVAGFNPNISATDLKKLINQFIEQANEDDDETDENEGEKDKELN